MSQRHTIHREIVEVTVGTAASAARISAAVSDAIREAMTPLLERLFDEMTPRAELIRIDRLELDLGRLDAATLSREWPAQIAARLPAALQQSAALARRPGDRTGSPGQAGRTRPDADTAALLVIGHFVATGTLPWWCDGRDRDLLDRAANDALRRSPASLAHSLRGFASDPTAMNRLIGHLTEETLARMMAALAPDSAGELRELSALLEGITIGDLTPRQQRIARWRGLLQTVCAGPRADMTETALTAIAVAAGVPLAAVLARVDLPITSSSTNVTARLAELRRPHATRDPTEPRPARNWMRDPALATLQAELAPLAARLSDTDQAKWADALERLAQAPIGASFDAALSAVLQPLRQAGLLTAAEAERLQTRLSRRPAPTRERSDADESQVVMAAGLCLLWPFLPRLFARCGLLDAKETGFASLTTQQRAVLLLHHLATGEPDAPEFALLLPKVLCGLPPFDPCEIVEPITATEQMEAAQMLDAAIAHASGLGAISHAGLRETFLMRPGLLGTRDGAWLLRLEQRSTDVLLERIPWTLQWLRLPWMQAAMRVEW